MKNISFSLTERQLKDGTKDVTRRIGWGFLKPGDRLCAIRKGMGLKPGEKVVRFGVIEIVDVRREPLNAITVADCAREGFPEMCPYDFVEFFAKSMRVPRDQVVTRIQFKVVVRYKEAL